MTRKTKRALKDLEALPPALRQKAETLIKSLDAEPDVGHRLKGKLEGLRSIRLGRTHRIIYSSAPRVVVITVRGRKDTYR
ncbi:Plasmid stabilization system protein [Mycobacterium bohemicum DSM 44277]|uniref:Plasmid stabilization system protein n=1 Tax=Mycobacterium bohemicum DSM 44277 TaxID=1236609 RepID=A0A0U0W452_MYCBE|nr:type II toxin-antitoxin system RelE/ParE family toxin [Mycobacterium bohemicum]MCV6972751.1 type II toxin-antitoxin system RelE/ParE family toxin [Mycobacterium bohemicum]CPR04276.1 Plasmid stabilization system protein [Mycobacterium bohemicum DSM 44277]